MSKSTPQDAASIRREALEEAAMTHDNRVSQLLDNPKNYKHGKLTKSAKRALDFHERSAAAIRALHHQDENDDE